MHGVGDLAEPAVYVDDLTVRHGRGRAVVFEQVTFRIDPGELVALMGPNGCGKTTLLRALLGEIPSEGSIVIHGHHPTGAVVGYVPQSHDWERDFPITVGEVILAGRRASRRLFGRVAEADRAKVCDVLGELGLELLCARSLAELSGGQFRRVLIARALVQEPDVLLLDEPFAGLDDGASQIVLQALRDRVERGVAVLACMHELHLVHAGFSRVLGLEGGIVADGAPQDVLRASPIGMFQRTSDDLLTCTTS